jgi:excisionase family DNA binding protein
VTVKLPALAVEMPDEFVQAIAHRVAEILDARPTAEPSPWMNVSQAAEYLACPTSRIYALVSAGRLPHERDGSRLLFQREQLDAFVQHGGAKRP